MAADASAVPAAQHSIPWHRRLEARVLVFVCLIAGFSLATLTLVTGRVVESHALSRAAGDLSSAQAAFSHLISTRTQFVAAQTRLITTLPVFRAHMVDVRVAADAATMEAMADTYRTDLSAAFCVVTDADGRWLASPGLESRAGKRALDPGIRVAAGGQSHHEILAIDGRLFLVVSEPARFADEVLGTLTAAYRLDDTVAGELARTTGGEVVLTAGSEISGASLSNHRRAALATLLRTDPKQFARADDVGLRELGDARYIGGMSPLGGDDSVSTAGRLILLEDWKPTQDSVDDIRSWLLWTGAVVFALATVSSLVLSRRMSRPLREIAEVAEQIAAGNWDRRVPVRGSGEAEAMAHAFNGMTVSLSHWHAEARHRTEQLQASYERFHAITHSAHDAIVSTDAAGTIIFWNQSAEAAFGYTEREALGQPFLPLIAVACQELYSRHVHEVMRGAGESALARTFEGEGARRDGTTFPLELTLASWKAGAASYLTVIIRDTTERRRSQEAIRNRDEQLRQAQKMEAIGRLAGGVAHDFNNLLVVIYGYAELLVAGMDAHDARRADLEQVVKASHSASTLTRQLLAFSRRQILAPQILRLSDVVSGVERMLRRLLGEDVELITRIDADVDCVRADPGQLEQVIVNLAVNARDAMPHGGRVTIELRKTELTDPVVCQRLGILTGSYATIVVSDAGHGMDAETLSHIFEPFFTTKGPRKGTGLGLATVYGIVAQSGGTIDVESAPGRGTTFRIHLPRVEHGESAIVVTDVDPVSLRGVETVLLVEDEVDVRTIIRKALEQYGYAVLEAGSAEAAMDIARRHLDAIHVLLTDIVMPGTSGHALAESLSAWRPDMRVIYMTGHPEDTIVRQGLDPTSVRCLQKPFSLEALCRELRSVLEPAEAGLQA
jgi:PAS domain S-box-containing protein